MTRVGHILTGISIGVVSLPENKSTRYRIFLYFVFGLLAYAPDFPLFFWIHNHYEISHSLFVNLLLIFVLSTALAFLHDLRASVGGWPAIIGGAFAWLSHLLLDTFYNNGQGLMVFWPLSDFQLALPIPWFSIIENKPPPFTLDNMHEYLIELAFYGSLLLIVVYLKKVKLFDWIRRNVLQTNKSHPTRRAADSRDSHR